MGDVREVGRCAAFGMAIRGKAQGRATGGVLGDVAWFLEREEQVIESLSPLAVDLFLGQSGVAHEIGHDGEGGLGVAGKRRELYRGRIPGAFRFDLRAERFSFLGDLLRATRGRPALE